MRLHERENKFTITQWFKGAKNALFRSVNSAGLIRSVPFDDVVSVARDYKKTPDYFEVFDDFLQNATDATNNWITFAGTDGGATALLIAAANTPEGQATMGNGNADGTEDGAASSLIVLTKGALTSLGGTVVEYRVSLDALTGRSVWLGLADKIATTTERVGHIVDSGVVTDGGLTLANAVGFSFSSDATATTKWTITSENATAIVAAEEALAVGPTADIYQLLRIEVNAAGDAEFFIDGVKLAERKAAVATAALLIPYFACDSGTDAQTDGVLTLDSVLFQGNRPTSNA